MDFSDFPALSGYAPTKVPFRISEMKDNFEEWAKYISLNPLAWCMELQNVIIGLIAMFAHGQRPGYLKSLRVDQVFIDQHGMFFYLKTKLVYFNALYVDIPCSATHSPF